MTLNDRDLSQMNTDYLDDLPEGELRSLSKQLLTALKEARERLKQSPETSSRPPSSREPWKASPSHNERPDDPLATEESSPSASAAPSGGEISNQDLADSPTISNNGQSKKAGRQVGSQGHSRNLTLAVTQTLLHHLTCCGVCGTSFADSTDYFDTVFRGNGLIILNRPAVAWMQ